MLRIGILNDRRIGIQLDFDPFHRARGKSSTQWGVWAIKCRNFEIEEKQPAGMFFYNRQKQTSDIMIANRKH